MIKIVPLRGITKVRHGRKVVDKYVTTEMDSILEGKYCLGHVKREPGAAICLVQRVSESTQAEIRRAVDERDRELAGEDGDYSGRKLVSVPEVPEELLE
jgi:hypothetical protein